MLKYAIYYQDIVAGHAELEKQGMYYRVCCKCDKSDDAGFRIQMQAGEKTLDLGICIHAEGGIGIITRVPVREVNGSELHFRLINETSDELFEITAEEPFLKLSELDHAKFVRRGNKTYISLR